MGWEQPHHRLQWLQPLVDCGGCGASNSVAELSRMARNPPPATPKNPTQLACGKSRETPCSLEGSEVQRLFAVARIDSPRKTSGVTGRPQKLPRGVH